MAPNNNYWWHIHISASVERSLGCFCKPHPPTPHPTPFGASILVTDLGVWIRLWRRLWIRL